MYILLLILEITCYGSTCLFLVKFGVQNVIIMSLNNLDLFLL